jgi:hypothetical protein
MMVENHIETWNSCQHNKQSNKKAYGKMPLVSALQNKDPWQMVHLIAAVPEKFAFRTKKQE